MAVAEVFGLTIVPPPVMIVHVPLAGFTRLLPTTVVFEFVEHKF